MDWKFVINIIQILASFLLIASIVLQARGSGLGSAFGGEGMVFRTKRGIEKILHLSSIVLAVIFLALSLASIFV